MLSVRTCGFLDMPNFALEGSIPDALAAFLKAGEAPVYMTFDSWMPRDIPGHSVGAADRRVAGPDHIIVH